jgi:capsular exopolysaccharide synthesis family protein
MATLEPRVLLIDADMRRPTLHQMANCSNDVGLSDVLSGGHSLSECVHEIAPNLDLLASGKEPGNPVSLLRASQFDELIKTASQGYAMVIVDTPALASVTDSLLVSARVDGTVLVIAENTTDESEAKRVIAELSAVGINNVLGIVLNMDTKRVTDYSDYFVTMARGNVLPGA